VPSDNFDIEIIFPLPVGGRVRPARVFELVEMVLFIVTRFVAYAYVSRARLEWD
jgi:NADH:ubiquinone oxidoreductase subunit 3 (subunit A)